MRSRSRGSRARGYSKKHVGLENTTIVILLYASRWVFFAWILDLVDIDRNGADGM